MIKTSEELRAQFWQEDMLYGGGIIRSQYDEIKRVLSENDIEWVNQRLKEIKFHAIKNTELYKNYKITDNFPVVNKTVLIENSKANMAKEGFLTPLHITSTSGSTGTPFTVVQDYKKRNRTIADLKVFGELCDYPSHERMVYFRAISAKLHRTPEQEDAENIYYKDCSNLDDAHLEEMKQFLLEKKPRIVFGYSSTLVELAKYIKRIDYSAVKFSMKSVLTGGEGLSEEYRKLLEEVFCCKVYRRYSDMEMGILGQDSANGSEYFLNWGSYYFECLKMDSDQPADYGEVGRIVVTDLFNYAFPMIRYDTGDLGILEKGQNGTFPELREIYGRIRDCIYTVDGSLISPAKVSVSMWGVEGIKQWQFIQEDKDRYVIKLNCEKCVDEKLYIAKFKQILGETAKITIEYVDEIPVTSSNKRRAVICNYKKV